MTAKTGVPRLVASVATVTSVLLAVATGGKYDPQLAVLTATLIAIIWYTYYTFLAVTKPEPVHIQVGMDFNYGNLSLHPMVRNQTRSRVVKVRSFLTATIEGGEDVDCGPFYRGALAEAVELGPGEGFTGSVSLYPEAKKRLEKETKFGFLVVGPTRYTARFHVEWEDDAGGKGRTPERVWLADTNKREFTALLGSTHVALFLPSQENAPS